MLPAGQFRASKACWSSWARGKAAVQSATFLPPTAGQAQGVPWRVLAPHRVAVAKSPAGLSFCNQPRCFTWGSFAVFSGIPTPHPSISGMLIRLSLQRWAFIVTYRRATLTPASSGQVFLSRFCAGPLSSTHRTQKGSEGHSDKCRLSRHRDTIHKLAHRLRLALVFASLRHLESVLRVGV
jgi:hypothetical protein